MFGEKFRNFVFIFKKHSVMYDKFVPVLLLTGYLGSGKTTLLNRILSNKKGIRFAVIVNDIGEVNIDATLIQKGGVVNQKDDSLVALQNGCICCTLKMDLVEQINDILKMDRFDYIVIEASGICEPAPIAQTICMMPRMDEKYSKYGIPRLDCICSVVDALRLQDEFACGDSLTKKDIDEEDIENLIIQQIEFCNIILLNKASEVSVGELQRIRKILRTIQPEARIIECNYCDVDLDLLLNTHLFNSDEVANSAAWVKGIDRPLDEIEEEEERIHHHHDEDNEEHEHHPHHHDDEHHHHDDDHDDEHEHHHHDDEDHHHGHHHHHHHHEGGEVEEYGIGTFVYYRRKPFDLAKFDQFVAKNWDRNIIRAKGVVYFKQNTDMSYLFEQAGKQKSISESGQWYATAPDDELREFMRQDPSLVAEWDEEYGDRMQKIVFIGQHLDKEKLIRELDACLTEL